MHITVPHHTTRAEARRKIEERLNGLERQYGHYASDIDKTWDGDRLTFAVKARGMSVAVTRAVERGATGVICASTGNTAASAAAYAARAGIEATIVVAGGAAARFGGS